MEEEYCSRYIDNNEEMNFILLIYGKLKEKNYKTNKRIIQYTLILLFKDRRCLWKHPPPPFYLECKLGISLNDLTYRILIFKFANLLVNL